MTDPLRRELREELARAINKTRPPTCDHPQCSCTYECERWDDMADSYLDAVDAMLPILTRELAAARKAERERCAVVADQKAQDYLSPKYATGQPLSSFAERFACGEIAAAIRALED